MLAEEATVSLFCKILNWDIQGWLYVMLGIKLNNKTGPGKAWAGFHHLLCLDKYAVLQVSDDLL
jgi:hypothetical protein